MKTLIISFMFVFASVSILVDGVVVTESELLFEFGLFPYSHVCSVLELDNGDILAVYQAGTGERKPDLKIYLSRKRPGKSEFEKPVPVVDLGGKCVMNPSLYMLKNGSIVLFFHSGGEPLEPNHCSTEFWKGYFQISHDYGVTWSAHSAMLDSVLGPVKNQCIRIEKSDTVLCPSSTESLIHWRSHMESTSEDSIGDPGSWTRTEDISFDHGLCRGIIQPTLFDIGHGSGEILALFRSDCGVLATARSEDFGRTWPAKANATALDNPNSGIDGITVRHAEAHHEELWLAYNPSTEHRRPLSLASSGDLGESWDRKLDVENGTTRFDSYEYPFFINSASESGVGHLCYTFKSSDGRSMKYARIEGL